MKLKGKLAEKAANAASKEELKEIIADAGMELTEDELNEVSGGDIIVLSDKGKNPRLL